jgi:ion channel
VPTTDPEAGCAVPAAAAPETGEVITRAHASPGVVLLAVVRPVLTVAVLLTAYYLLPVDRELTWWTFAGLAGGLSLIVVIVVWQYRMIMRARYPTLRGIDVLALTIPLYLVIFANVYFILAHSEPDSFTEPLTRTDALYFVLTVFATVGFGDITPVTHTARVLVTGQLAGNLLVIGVALRVITTAVQLGRKRKGGTP